MSGGIAGLLIRQARLGRDWSQAGLCRGICAPSYLSKIEQGKAAPSPEVTELLLRRLGLVWTPEPENLEPCWKALLSGSPDFASCYERLVQPRQESLACSPPFTKMNCVLCRRNGNHFSPRGSWLCSALCRADGRRRYGWIRCRFWSRSAERPSTSRVITPLPLRCCGTPTPWASPGFTCRGCWRGTKPTASTVRRAACWRSFL